MGLFGGSKSSSSSSTTNYSYTTSQSLGDLSQGNILSSGDVAVYGLYGEDMQNFVNNVGGMVDNIGDMFSKATSANSNLAGNAIAEVAKGYQSAYSESTGILQQLKPVLMVGAAAVALMFGLKYIK